MKLLGKCGLSGWAMMLAVVVLSGCYSFSGSGLPAGLRTVQIEPVQDRVRQSELADMATRAILAGFQKNGALRPVQNDGQSQLEIQLTGYTHAPQQFELGSTANVSRYRVTIGFSVKFTDLRDGSILFEGNNIGGFVDYDPQTSTELVAREKALAEAVKKVVDNTVSGW